MQEKSFLQYDVYKNPMENIGMQDSLLSRFDCLFVLLDEHDPEQDARIGEHIIRLHRYRAPGLSIKRCSSSLVLVCAGEADGQVLDMGTGIDVLGAARADAVEEAILAGAQGSNAADQIWETRRGWTAGGDGKKSERVVTADFLRKYVTLARSFRPILGDEASAYISDKYADLRSFDEARMGNNERTMPVTARQLETLIRLSTAIAKCRLSNAISAEDAQEAYDLLYYACFKEVTFIFFISSLSLGCRRPRNV
jgi:DNA replication licensing factor MCM3